MRWLTGLLLLTGGCASTTPHVVATGEPLEARGHTDHIPAYVNSRFEYVDEHDNFTFDGHFQGDTQIDELDFYHLTGDTAAEAGLIEWRTQRNRSVLLSWLGYLVSMGAVGAGAALWKSSGDESPDSLSSGLMIGGCISLGLSAFFLQRLFEPSESLNEFGFLYDYDRATAAASSHDSSASSE